MTSSRCASSDRCLSRVQILASGVINADAKSDISTAPQPDPCKLKRDTILNTSPSVAMTAGLSFCKSLKVRSLGAGGVPHAISRITKGWVSTWSCASKACNLGLATLKWATQTDVSTSTRVMQDAAYSGRRLGISGISGVAPPRAAKRLLALTLTNTLMASRNKSALSMSGSAISSAVS